MLEKLKQEVLEQNLALPLAGLVKCTWGNASARDSETGFIVIKPSGVAYADMRAADMVVVNSTGEILEGSLRPSSDLATHLYLYAQYPEIGGIVHTHSTTAVSFAQARIPIPALGTTHADYFCKDIPITRPLSAAEVQTEYEKNTGVVIAQTLAENQVQPLEMPGILVAGHGPFTWGKTVKDAVYHSIVLEEVAQMAYQTAQLIANPPVIEAYLQQKHYTRKHGKDAYYGQK